MAMSRSPMVIALTAALALATPITSVAGFITFSDAGNAMNKLSLRGLEYSVGGGIRFISPIGLVRLDGAFGISRKNTPFRLHISMGPDL